MNDMKGFKWQIYLTIPLSCPLDKKKLGQINTNYI